MESEMKKWSAFPSELSVEREHRCSIYSAILFSNPNTYSPTTLLGINHILKKKSYIIYLYITIESLSLQEQGSTLH